MSAPPTRPGPASADSSPAVNDAQLRVAEGLSGSDPGTPPPQQPRTAETLQPEDAYYEGPFLVFTAAFHLKRGYCCNSGCRHCPFR
ncbi:MAG TPA: DUF5522 domain-containing protein [Acidobacteriaceae bacterium]|jgi:hypothetical protein|nr:DUF5522 domain-containing protein [Acidobacteriaceae bacterium]